jgi:CBS domain-containing protein
MARTIRDVMGPPPACMTPADSVIAAARAMREQGTGMVLVVDDGELIGLLTDRDITIRVLADNHDAASTRLGDICSTDLVVVGPDDDAMAAVELIRGRAVRRVPVVDAGTPVGVVSIADLALAVGLEVGSV